jgi:two-component system, chemotaxis family, protein-glutamate methylesterase/glutaminase
VGHAYTAQTMVAEHAASVERALWVGLRMLQENASASRRLASRAAERGQVMVARRFLERAAELDGHARDLKNTLLRLGQATSTLEESSNQPID